MAGRVYYHLGEYVSHRTAGRANMRALAGRGVRFADCPEDAETLILHDDPFHIEPYVRRFGGKKRIITYAVWETDLLPESFVRQLKGVDEVWTCSPHSARAFLRAGFRVQVVPHVVAPPKPSLEESRKIASLLGPREGVFRFLTVVDSVNPRKNLKTLLEAYWAAFRGHRGVELVVKQYRHPWNLGSIPGVLELDSELTEGEMSALHRSCDAYVSAHHAEGWGLPLTDAMHAGKLVVATGHSGNMFFMNEHNSLPVRSRLAPVSPEMCEAYPLFTREMTWAEPDPAHLVHCLRRAVRMRSAKLRENARLEMRRFTPACVGKVMTELLQGLDERGAAPSASPPWPPRGEARAGI